ncbi:MAG: radical SAM protein [Rikenellaceae bacterium]|nr:radical SAM protein [Rikenellaceae bacterium]
MANIILTNTCNIQCPFCFASENNEQKAVVFDPMKTWKISSFIGSKTFRFCGGEPSLTPNITEMTQALLNSGYNIMMMTNGVWPESFRNFMLKLPVKFQVRFSYLFNILHPSFYKNNELQKICDNISLVNPLMCTLGFTIYKEDFDYEYLFELAEKFGIKKIRWSVAAPNISNEVDRLESQFEKIAGLVYKMHKEGAARGLTVHGDCNYIQPCHYDKNELNDLLINHSLKFGCSNSSPVDIAPDGLAWRCYGLYSVLQKNISEFEGEKDMERYFTRRVQLLKNLYAYEECKECEYLKKGCDGGCFVYRIKKAYKQNPDLVLFPIDDDKSILDCRPFRNRHLALNTDKQSNKLYFREKLILDEDENMISFLQEIDGQKTIQELINMWKDNFSTYDAAVNTIVGKCRELFEKDYIQLNYDYKIKPESRPVLQ